MRRAWYVAVFVLCLVVVSASSPCVVLAQQADQDQEYTSEQIKNMPAEVFLERMDRPEPGYQRFAAMHALGKKIKLGEPETRLRLLQFSVAAMNDGSRSINQRFQCCYAISDSGDEHGVPPLVNVLFSDPSETMRSVAAEALGYFSNSAAARDSLMQASKRETNAKVLEVINKRLAQGDKEYTPEQIKSTSAEIFLERLAKPEPGYQQFAAMRALGRKAKESNAEDRRAILSMVVGAMNDRSRTEQQRFLCCYVIAFCEDEQWVQYIVDVLFNDPSVTMRSVAAEALAGFPKSAAAQDALLQASQSEKSQKVLDVIDRRSGTAEYTAEQIESTSVEAFLEKMRQTEKGYQKFAALRALGRKARESDAAGRHAILTVVAAAMNDKSRDEFQRFQCCYVISDSGDAQWVPHLVYVLANDPLAVMRSVAAEALGKFKNSTAAHDALVKAAGVETNPRVLEVLKRVLGKTAPAS